ncbi:MAG: tetratricopeptide repeat protein, partial [Akkermansiaceae bacterium]|nr:tetratricopeptide repeat protein [Akkermansiaceae bacterium]
DENWNAVVKIFQRGEFPGEPDIQAGIYMLAGRALANLDRHHEAIRLFFNVERLSPLTDLGFEASYRRLASFYEVNGPNIAAQADSLIEIYGGKHPDHKWVQLALVMKAETLFHRDRMAEAAAAYSEVSPKNLPEDLLPGLYFKRGWALAESGDYNRAAQDLTTFISRFPDDPRVLQALAQRGSAYLKLGDRSSALKDFDQLLATATEPNIQAFAHQHRGRIFREDRRYESMIEAYTTLLNEHDRLSRDTVANANYWIGWGWFKLDEWAKCLPYLEQARSLVPANYKEPAGTHLVIAAYSLKDAEQLKKAVIRLQSDVPGKRLPVKMLTWLGLQLFQQGDFDGADTFLTLASNPEDPADTDLIVWRHLAKARIELRHYSRAMDVLPIVLEREESDFWRTDACLDKVHALIGLGKWDEARVACHEGLQMDPHGTILAGLNMSLGKIAMQRKDYESAAASFLRTAEVFIDDREIKPLALHLAAEALDGLERADQAAEIRAQLKREFPEWKPRPEPPAAPAPEPAEPAAAEAAKS